MKSGMASWTGYLMENSMLYLSPCHWTATKHRAFDTYLLVFTFIVCVSVCVCVPGAHLGGVGFVLPPCASELKLSGFEAYTLCTHWVILLTFDCNWKYCLCLLLVHFALRSWFHFFQSVSSILHNILPAFFMFLFLCCSFFLIYCCFWRQGLTK